MSTASALPSSGWMGAQVTFPCRALGYPGQAPGDKYHLPQRFTCSNSCPWVSLGTAPTLFSPSVVFWGMMLMPRSLRCTFPSLSANEWWDNVCSKPGIWLMKVFFMSSALVCALALVDAFLGALLPAILLLQELTDWSVTKHQVPCPPFRGSCPLFCFIYSGIALSF